mgnify:CR=1 FL=1
MKKIIVLSLIVTQLTYAYFNDVKKVNYCEMKYNSAIDNAMNINSPALNVSNCWADNIAYGGSVTLMWQRVSQREPISTIEQSAAIRVLNLFTDIKINKNAVFHMGTYNRSDLISNSLDLDNWPLDTTPQIQEAYLNYKVAPGVFIKAGLDWASFGNYSDPYPPVYSFHEGFAQARNTHVTLGLAPENIPLSFLAYVYKDGNSDKWNQSGFRFDYISNLFGLLQKDAFGLNVSFVKDYSTLNGAYSQYALNPQATGHEGAYDIGSSIKLGSFDLNIDYFKATGPLIANASSDTTEPKLLSTKVAYNFLISSKKSNLHAMYERAWNSSEVFNYAFFTGIKEDINFGADIYMLDNAKFSLDYYKMDVYNTGLIDGSNVANQNIAVAAIKVYF